MPFLIFMLQLKSLIAQILHLLVLFCHPLGFGVVSLSNLLPIDLDNQRNFHIHEGYMKALLLITLIGQICRKYLIFVRVCSNRSQVLVLWISRYALVRNIYSYCNLKSTS